MEEYTSIDAYGDSYDELCHRTLQLARDTAQRGQDHVENKIQDTPSPNRGAK